MILAGIVGHLGACISLVSVARGADIQLIAVLVVKALAFSIESDVLKTTVNKKIKVNFLYNDSVLHGTQINTEFKPTNRSINR